MNFELDTLIAIVSVIRPGAANNLKKRQFCRRAQGLEPITYAHPSLESVLRSTFGVVAYEEHILQICEAFAGMAPGRADYLRRALVKMDARKIDDFSRATRSHTLDRPTAHSQPILAASSASVMRLRSPQRTVKRCQIGSAHCGT